jgi:HAD superfamily hydrolase (TIGR01490 family)
MTAMNLALFDIDNTLIAIDSDHAWGHFLVAQGVVDRDAYERANDHFYALYKAGTLNILEYLEFALAPLASHPRARLDAWHEEFMEKVIRPQISAKARALVQQHLDAGDVCCCVTATNAFVTAPIAREFGVPHLIAIDLEEHEGRYTGKPRGIPSFQEGKILRVEGWLATMDQRISDYPRSFFYSDSRNDLPLLLRVTDPVAVNPDPVLKAEADSRGWPILDLHE